MGYPVESWCHYPPCWQKRMKSSSSTIQSRSVGLPKPWPPIETDKRNGEKQGSERKKWQIKTVRWGWGRWEAITVLQTLGWKQTVMVECEAGCVCVCMYVYSRDLGEGGRCNWGAQREEHNNAWKMRYEQQVRWEMKSSVAELIFFTTALSSFTLSQMWVRMGDYCESHHSLNKKQIRE